MNCPRDDSVLVARETHGVHIDACEQCGGMLLHRGDLNRVAEPTGGDVEFSTLDLDSFEHEDVYPPAPCPRCGEASIMKKVSFNIYTSIILDYCEHCRGFWLDGRELDRINGEIKDLNEAAEEVDDPPMLWFARFVWSLPR